jgi:hypothetical protein
VHDLLDHRHPEVTQSFGVVGQRVIGQPRPVTADRDHWVVADNEPIVAGHVDVELDQVCAELCYFPQARKVVLLGGTRTAVCYPENVGTGSLLHRA